MNFELNPVIIVFDDHAIAGLMTTKQGIRISGTFDDHDEIRKWCNPQESDTNAVPLSPLIPLECVGLTQGNSEDCDLSFARSVQRGREKIESRAPKFIFDVASRHAKGIEPLPCQKTSPKRVVLLAMCAVLTVALVAASLLFFLGPGPP